MSWDDYYRRRAAIKSVLSFAEQNPNAALPFYELPEVHQNFTSRHELLLALQYDWSQALWAQIELLSLDSSLSEASRLAQQAWAACATKHPVLRRVLDQHRTEIRPVVVHAPRDAVHGVA